MRPAVPGRPVAAPSILLGIVRVAFGRRDGIARFGNSREAFLASLAPLIAFPLVGGAIMLAGGAGRSGAMLLLATICALLAPPVLSFEMARLWRREQGWLRFATALNWCQWVMPVVGVLLLGIVAPLLATALAEHAALNVTAGMIVFYQLWLHWFLARHGLLLSPLRSVALVLVVNLGTAVLVVGPALLAGP